MSTAGTAKDADLTAVWMPHGGIDENLRTHIHDSAKGPKPLLARGIESEGQDLVLVPTLQGPTPPLAAAVGRDGADVVSYWRRYPADAGQTNIFDRVPYLFSVRVFAPPPWQQPLRDWLDQEHFERQTSMEGVFASEGYEPVTGQFHFFNLWAIAHPDLIDSAEWIKVRDSPWYEEVRPGFQASVVRREIYRTLEPDS